MTVGAGGTSGNNAAGGNGNTTSFGDGTLLSAGGGGGGANGTSSELGGTGGSGSGGDLNLKGGEGDHGSGADDLGGSGGASYFGGGGRGAVGTGNGNAGAAPGSGAGGGVDTSDGGIGADGIVIVWEHSGSAGSDLAEWYETDGSVEAGDIVGISSDSTDYETGSGLQKIAVLTKANLDKRIVGIVSTAPGELIGNEIIISAKNPRPIALTGRVPVKVTTKNGSIKKGDLLTLSSIPGVAMKTNKAGQIIGAALEDYAGASDQIGKVLVFVQTQYSTGARFTTIMEKQGFNMSEIPANTDVGKLILAQLLSQKKDIRSDVPLSEIYTDRVTAGLEIISPRVVTESLSVDYIEPALQKDIVVNLATGSAFIIKGELIADKIRANQIEGLDILVSSIKYKVSSEATQSAQILTPTQIPIEIPESAQPLVLTSLNVDGLVTISGDVRVYGSGLINGVLNVIDSITSGNLIVSMWADFLGSVIFRGDVHFLGTPKFSQDTAGTSIIKKGEDRVEVKFEKEYEKNPEITANIVFDEGSQVDDGKILEQNYSLIISKRSAKGFFIRLNKPAVEDISVSWAALAVVREDRVENPEPTLSKEPTATVIPIPTPELSIYPLFNSDNISTSAAQLTGEIQP